MLKISCIIPAYNEGKRIAHVLKIIENHPLVNETIVINDGSTDNTAEVVRKFKKVKFLNNKKNLGKIKTMIRGLDICKNNTVMFIDSDLVGLTKEDIAELIKPVAEGRADITISLRKNAPWFWRIVGMDFISGERVFNKNIIKNHKELTKLPGWGLETYMNKQVIKNNLRIKVVRWNNVESPWPQEKFGYLKGTKRLMGMMIQVFRTGGLFGTIWMVPKMLSLRVS